MLHEQTLPLPWWLLTTQHVVSLCFPNQGGNLAVHGAGGAHGFEPDVCIRRLQLPCRRVGGEVPQSNIVIVATIRNDRAYSMPNDSVARQVSRSASRTHADIRGGRNASLLAVGHATKFMERRFRIE